MQGRQRLSLLIFIVIVSLVCCRKKDAIRSNTPPDPHTPTDTLPGTDTVPVNTPRDTVAYVQTAMHIAVNGNIGGFYQALPPGYDSSDKKYPLLLFLHGGGERGNGGSDLPLVLKNAIPNMLEKKTFPLSFTVQGESFSFVIISPQFIIWPVPADVDAMLKYSINHY
ncbi:MAG: hypothetical protein ABI415_09760, partial [Flavitalea sp.]